jgi:hypothetical protein
MKSIITFGMNSGLGDSYNCIYRAFVTHEYLKELGYETTTYINLGLNPYKMDNDDRSIFKRIFCLDKFDNLNILMFDFNDTNVHFPKNYELIFNDNNIYKVYVDKKINVDYNFNSYVNWGYSDNLPKYNLFTKEIIDFCENKIKTFPPKYYCLHYRWHEMDNKEISFNNYKNIMFNFIEKYENTPIFICSSDQNLKKRFYDTKYKNIFFNNYEFPDNWYTRTYNWDNEKLMEFFKETIFEMYVISKSEKILTLCYWFSSFLFFSSSYNQTSISNKLRYCHNLVN